MAILVAPHEVCEIQESRTLPRIPQAAYGLHSLFMK